MVVLQLMDSQAVLLDLGRDRDRLTGRVRPAVSVFISCGESSFHLSGQILTCLDKELRCLDHVLQLLGSQVELLN